MDREPSPEAYEAKKIDPEVPLCEIVKGIADLIEKTADVPRIDLTDKLKPPIRSIFDALRVIEEERARKRLDQATTFHRKYNPRLLNS